MSCDYLPVSNLPASNIRFSKLLKKNLGNLRGKQSRYECNREGISGYPKLSTNRQSAQGFRTGVRVTDITKIVFELSDLSLVHT